AALSTLMSVTHCSSLTEHGFWSHYATTLQNPRLLNGKQSNAKSSRNLIVQSKKIRVLTMVFGGDFMLSFSTLWALSLKTRCGALCYRTRSSQRTGTRFVRAQMRRCGG